MKKLLVVLVGLMLLVSIGSTINSNQHLVYMPLVYDASTDPPPTPTPLPTKTPKPPPPTPTPTPTYQWAEGGNTCAYVWAARDKATGSGTAIWAQVPSVCSILEIDRIEQDGTLVVVRAHRIKTDTYGCFEDDFGPLVEWPPPDDECPPPTLPPPSDEWGRPLWGNLTTFDIGFNTKIVCGYCEECGEPYTLNCKETTK